jgi:hypothetical protein
MSVVGFLVGFALELVAACRLLPALGMLCLGWLDPCRRVCVSPIDPMSGLCPPSHRPLRVLSRACAHACAATQRVLL